MKLSSSIGDFHVDSAGLMGSYAKSLFSSLLDAQPPGLATSGLLGRHTSTLLSSLLDALPPCSATSASDWSLLNYPSLRNADAVTMLASSHIKNVQMHMFSPSAV